MSDDDAIEMVGKAICIATGDRHWWASYRQHARAVMDVLGLTPADLAGLADGTRGVVEVPTEATYRDAPNDCTAVQASIWADGWNSCLAALSAHPGAKEPTDA